MFIVNGLNTSPARYVVLGRRQFECRIVRQVHRHLHQALAKSARSQHHSSVEVLQRAASNFAGAGRIAVDKHHDGHHGVYGFNRCAVLVVRALQFSAVGNDEFSFWYEHVYDAYSLRFGSAAIAAKVEHKVLHAFLFKVEEGTAHLARAIFGKPRKVDVAHIVGLHAIIGHGRRLDGLTGNLKLHDFAR